MRQKRTQIYGAPYPFLRCGRTHFYGAAYPFLRCSPKLNLNKI